LTALRTSWSVRTLQEQTIMEMKGSFGDAVPDEILKSAMRCKRKKPDFKQFQTGRDDLE
jgi:hypothetical protein